MRVVSLALVGLVTTLGVSAFAQPKPAAPPQVPKAAAAKPAPKAAAVKPAPKAEPAAPAVTPPAPVAEDAAPASAAPAVEAASAPPAASDATPPCPPGAVCESAVPAPPAPTEAASEDASHSLDVAADGTMTLQIPPPPPGIDARKPRVVVLLPATGDKPERAILLEDTDLENLGTFDEGQFEEQEEPEYPLRRRRLPPLRLESTRWGIAARGVGAYMSRNGVAASTSGVGGIGGSLRYRPILPVALDLGIDVFGGIDANGWARREVPLSASALVYLNPKSRAQFYLVGGVSYTFAAVQSNVALENLAGGTYDEYNYAGLHAGLGFEFRLSTAIGFHLEALGVGRTRVDSDGNGRFTEYYDPQTGLASNTSALGLGRAGVSIWW
ncbi:MAG: hypothetical protein FJ095_07665 [Deltaproteobacteria bacterium]|nr:hypothetical protein [Deltaproteobacteria bacterium]